jgi:hypothetical protein
MYVTLNTAETTQHTQDWKKAFEQEGMVKCVQSIHLQHSKKQRFTVVNMQTQVRAQEI